MLSKNFLEVKIISVCLDENTFKIQLLLRIKWAVRLNQIMQLMILMLVKFLIFFKANQETEMKFS